MHLLHFFRVLFGNVGGLFDVLIEMIQFVRHGDSVIQDSSVGFRATDGEFVRALADCEGTVMMIVDDRFVEGDGPRFPRQCFIETGAVFCGLAVEGDVQHFGQSRKNVVEDDGRGTLFARFDSGRPADKKRDTVPTLFEPPLPAGTGAVAVVAVDHGIAADPALPVSAGAVDGAVVAGEDDERVVRDAEIIQLAEQSADMVIEFGDEIAVGTGFAFAEEFLVGDDRIVGRGHRVVEEEGLIRFRADGGLDELASLVRECGNEPVHGVAFGDDVIVPAKPFAVLRFGLGGGERGNHGDAVVLDEGRGVHLRGTGGAERVGETKVPGSLQGGRREVDIFEVLVIGIDADLFPLAFVMQFPVDSLVPFANQSRVVAGILQEVRDRLAARFNQGSGEVREVAPRAQAGPPHVAAGEQAVTGGNTIGACGVGVREGQALVSQLIQIGGRNAAAFVKGGDITQPHIVGEYNHHMRLTRLSGRRYCGQ